MIILGWSLIVWNSSVSVLVVASTDNSLDFPSRLWPMRLVVW